MLEAKAEFEAGKELREKKMLRDRKIASLPPLPPAYKAASRGIRRSHTAPSLAGFTGLAKIEDSAKKARKVAKVAEVKAAKDARGSYDKPRMGNPSTPSVLPEAGGSGKRQENGGAGAERKMAERGVGSFGID